MLNGVENGKYFNISKITQGVIWIDAHHVKAKIIWSIQFGPEAFSRPRSIQFGSVRFSFRSEAFGRAFSQAFSQAFSSAILYD
jgi:hypothetical protein